MKTPFKLSAPPPGWLDRFPDGDYTIGRGANPHAEPLLAEATLKRQADAVKARRPTPSKRKRSPEVAK